MSVQRTLVLQTVFTGVDEETLAVLRQVARAATYPANTKLIRQGESDRVLYIVVEGMVAVTQRLEDGEERLLGTVGPKKMFGEMALIDNSPRMATCTTLQETTVLEIDEATFDAVVESSPAVAYAILRQVLDSTRRLDRSAIEELTAKNQALQQALAELRAAQAELVEKERLEKELEVAAAMQRSLLPASLPDLPKYGFAAALKPARQVGGDFYDVVVLDEEHVGILIADVADKGVHAALFMAVARTLFLQESRQSLSPSVVAQMVHEGLLAISAQADVFVTAFYGVVHVPSGRLVYVRAAHDRPLLYRLGGGVLALPGDGRFLGMLPDLSLSEQTIQLKPGDRLVLFSDGLPDAENLEKEMFGSRRLAQVVAKYGGLSAQEMVDGMVTAVNQFTGSAPPFDDLTLLIVAAK
jgi:serine phosphatase RsbU (regulator of sigma subunit)